MVHWFANVQLVCAQPLGVTDVFFTTMGGDERVVLKRGLLGGRRAGWGEITMMEELSSCLCFACSWQQLQSLMLMNVLSGTMHKLIRVDSRCQRCILDKSTPLLCIDDAGGGCVDNDSSCKISSVWRGEHCPVDLCSSSMVLDGWCWKTSHHLRVNISSVLL